MGWDGVGSCGGEAEARTLSRGDTTLRPDLRECKDTRGVPGCVIARLVCLKAVWRQTGGQQHCVCWYSHLRMQLNSFCTEVNKDSSPYLAGIVALFSG